MSYSFNDYGTMIADAVRMSAYEDALRRTVKPDSFVLDIGAGPGVMAILAASLGARRVVAVEPNPLLRIGSRLAGENELTDRIQFIHGLSQQIELKELADVVVADLRGGLPNQPEFIDVVMDARRRLMKPEGTLIPLCDTINAAPVQAREAWSKLVGPWTNTRFGFGMSGAAEAALNQGLVEVKKVDRLLGSGQPVASLDYSSVDSPNIDAVIESKIEDEGVVHGFSLWFDTELVPGVGFSTAPDGKAMTYPWVFLPLGEPTEVEVGCRIRLAIKAVVDKATHLWVWRGRVLGPDGSKIAGFSQSSAFFNPESPSVQEVFGDDCLPGLSADGDIVREVLLGADGQRRVVEIATAVRAGHPDRFEYQEDAVNFVRSVLQRYGETMFRVEG